MEENLQSPEQSSLRPHRGTLILVLGILGLVCCGICGIIAWVMGKRDLQDMDAGTMDPSGQGMTQAGKICGMIGVILWIISFVVWLLMVILGTAGAVVSA